jgi:hypothetical protein
MNPSIASHSRKILLLTSAVALVALLPSCLPPPQGLRVRATLHDPGHYDALPGDYRGDYYMHDGRYYYGGRNETGHYRSNGRVYGNRYYHGGRYYYGGQYYARPR